MYHDFILIGDFNLQPHDTALKSFLQTYNCVNLINSPTCYKSLSNPSCIDLIITNRKMCFQHTNTICTGISDHHRLVYTMFKSTFKKLQPKKLIYRSFKNFSPDAFSNHLESELKGCKNLSIFDSTLTNVLNFHAPLKTKLLKGNNKPFVTKELRKAIMLRSHLKRISERLKTEEAFKQYKSQRNHVVNLNKREKKRSTSNTLISAIIQTHLYGKFVNLSFRIKLVIQMSESF